MLTTNFSLGSALLGTSKSFLRDSHVEYGSMPWRRAAARTKAFQAEPGWRWPCVARLNGACSNCLPGRPPTIARTSPVWLSIATSAAAGPPGLERWLFTASSALVWRSRSSVVLIFRPPLNAFVTPKRSTTCPFTHEVKYGARESSRGGWMV